MEFLNLLSEQNEPLETTELNGLMRQKTLRDPTPFTLADQRFYMNHYNHHADTDLRHYLSLENTFDLLHHVFLRLYGLRMEISDINHGEVWDDLVKKLVFHDEKGNFIGTVYLDLFRRKQDNHSDLERVEDDAAIAKNAHAAHYTLQCSRRVDNDPTIPYLIPDVGHDIIGRAGKWQLPKVVISCDLPRPTTDGPFLLTWQALETISHEMGHAIHCRFPLHIMNHI